MPYLARGSSRAVARPAGSRGGALSVADALRVAADVAAGLTALHRNGLVHRDVKPANILLRNGTALLTDFGLAKGEALTLLTEPGQLVGTPQYLAPELSREAARHPPLPTSTRSAASSSSA